jgi:hypothetical protein
MPTTISESDQFDATVQRPNNGELADAASILLFSQKFANRTRYTYNRVRTRMYDVTRAGYGADPTGIADSTAAIQAAINDADAAGGGDVMLPGRFKHTGLTVPLGVNLRGVPGAVSRLLTNHASNNALTFSGSLSRNFCKVTDLSLCAAIGNNGNVFNVAVPAWLKLENVSINDDLSGGALSGNFIRSGSAGSIVVAEESYFNFTSTVHLAIQTGAGSLLKIRDSQLIAPATFSSDLIGIDDGQLELFDNVFDLTAHGSGALVAINLASAGYHRLHGNHFKSGGHGETAIASLAGLKITETGSTFEGLTAYAIGGTLALGSELTLQTPFASLISGSGNIPCSAGYRAQTFKCLNAYGGNGPTLLLPAVLFPGQEFTVTIWNKSGTNWVFGVGVFGPVIGAGSGPIADSKARTFHFRALDLKGDGTFNWVQIGDASSELVP